MKIKSITVSVMCGSCGRYHNITVPTDQLDSIEGLSHYAQFDLEDENCEISMATAIFVEEDTQS